jgi:hypothetical protein
LRKVAAICAYSQDDPPLRNPIIGIAVCCARAARGYATHRRTAQQCDELASFQMIKLHLTAPARDFAAAYDRRQMSLATDAGRGRAMDGFGFGKAENSRRSSR